MKQSKQFTALVLFASVLYVAVLLEKVAMLLKHFAMYVKCHFSMCFQLTYMSQGKQCSSTCTKQVWLTATVCHLHAALQLQRCLRR